MFWLSREEPVFEVILKCMVTSDFRERLCLFSGEDAGQSGDNFAGFSSGRLLVEGVSEGTQNEGNDGFAA